MSEAQAERVFYEGDGVRVTSARFQVGAQTYAMSSVSSVAYRKQEPSHLGSIFVGCLGAPFLLLGVIALSGSMAKVVAIALLLFGVFLLGGAIVNAVKARPTFTVALTTASGQVSALSSLDASAVEPVVRALNEALVSRG